MKSSIPSYLNKYTLYEPLILDKPNPDLSLVIVIPSYKEDYLFQALESLLLCVRPDASIEIIPVLNYPESKAIQNYEFHQKQYNQLLAFAAKHNTPQFQIKPIPPIAIKGKHAGVGHARKIGMDEAVRRFFNIGNRAGVILNFDADCTCHEEYLEQVYSYFNQANPKSAVSIDFEHQFELLSGLARRAIVTYELHLRYYIAAQKFIHYPFAFQTLGSCFAVRAEAYCLQGGMNQRQAGEDFYFLHKYSLLNELAEIKRVLVYPSARSSDRVPFGTGKAVIEFFDTQFQWSYSLDAILLFQKLMRWIKQNIELPYEEWSKGLEQLSPMLAAFFINQGIVSAFQSFKSNTASSAQCSKKMIQWLSPFRLMKWLHYARTKGYPDIPVCDAVNQLMELMDPQFEYSNDEEHLLKKMREYFL
jgi:hypothetical protein